MSDDPNKRYQDGWTVFFRQPHEYEYFKREILKEFPFLPEKAIENAILNARKAVAPSEGREKLKECVRKLLFGN